MPLKGVIAVLRVPLAALDEVREPLEVVVDALRVPLVVVALREPAPWPPGGSSWLMFM